MLDKLKSRHREIARLSVEGVQSQEIAQRLGMQPAGVSTILNDPLCQAHIAKLENLKDDTVLDVRKKLAEMNVHALDVLEDLLTGEAVSNTVKLSAAKDVLDRTGYKPPDVKTSWNMVVTSEDLAELRANRDNYKQTRINKTEPIDITPTKAESA